MIEELPAEIDTIPSVAIGEKAEVAHAVEAVREDVQKKVPNELVRAKAHDLLAIATIATVILPSKGNMAIIDLDDAAVGDGNPMSVAADIGEHLIRAPNGGFE